MTITIYAIGAALLAVWFDARRPAPSLGRAFAHTAAAFVVLQLLVPALHAVDADRAAPTRLVGILVLLVLPAFAYAFFAVCRPLRVLSSLRSFG